MGRIPLIVTGMKINMTKTADNKKAASLFGFAAVFRLCGGRCQRAAKLIPRSITFPPEYGGNDACRQIHSKFPYGLREIIRGQPCKTPCIELAEILQKPIIFARFDKLPVAAKKREQAPRRGSLFCGKEKRHGFCVHAVFIRGTILGSNSFLNGIEGITITALC